MEEFLEIINDEIGIRRSKQCGGENTICVGDRNRACAFRCDDIGRGIANVAATLDGNSLKGGKVADCRCFV
jgi:hypothetical protein